MAQNSIFLPEQLLAGWLACRSAELSSDELMLFPYRRRFRLVEAARIVAEVTAAGDPFGITGQVKTLNSLLELGAEFFDSSMILDDAAFEVVRGWLATPLGSFDEYLQGLGSVPARAENDAALLRAFAARNG